MTDPGGSRRSSAASAGEGSLRGTASRRRLPADSPRTDSNAAGSRRGSAPGAPGADRTTNTSPPADSRRETSSPGVVSAGQLSEGDALELQPLRDVFALFDQDGSGRIPVDNARSFVASFAAAAGLELDDDDDDGDISFEDFCGVVAHVRAQLPDGPSLRSMADQFFLACLGEIFEAAEQQRLRADELQGAFAAAAPWVSREAIERAVGSDGELESAAFAAAALKLSRDAPIPAFLRDLQEQLAAIGEARRQAALREDEGDQESSAPRQVPDEAAEGSDAAESKRGDEGEEGKGGVPRHAIGEAADGADTAPAESNRSSPAAASEGEHREAEAEAEASASEEGAPAAEQSNSRCGSAAPPAERSSEPPGSRRSSAAHGSRRASQESGQQPTAGPASGAAEGSGAQRAHAEMGHADGGERDRQSAEGKTRECSAAPSEAASAAREPSRASVAGEAPAAREASRGSVADPAPPSREPSRASAAGPGSRRSSCPAGARFGPAPCGSLAGAAAAASEGGPAAAPAATGPPADGAAAARRTQSRLLAESGVQRVQSSGSAGLGPSSSNVGAARSAGSSRRGSTHEDPAWRARVLAMYQHYAPEKAAGVDALMDQEQWRGRPEELLRVLQAKYGPEPDPDPGAEAARRRVAAMYERYAPEKLPMIDTVLSRYIGREQELLSALVTKYGPEPDVPTADQEAAGEQPAADAAAGQKETWIDHERRVQLAYRRPSAPEQPGEAPREERERSAADRIRAMFARYAPEKVPLADKLLEKYAGREDEVLLKLVEKYGPEPAAGERAGPRTYRERILAIFEAYAPEKCGIVDSLLSKYAGREEEVIAKLAEKYGPEPAPPEPAAGGDTPQPAAPEDKPQPESADAQCAAEEQPPGEQETPPPRAGAGPPAAGSAQHPAEAPPPAAEQQRLQRESWKRRLVAFYEVHNPSKVPAVDSLLDQYAGHEIQLYDAVVRKYLEHKDSSQPTPPPSQSPSPLPQAPVWSGRRPPPPPPPPALQRAGSPLRTSPYAPAQPGAPHPASPCVSPSRGSPLVIACDPRPRPVSMSPLPPSSAAAPPPPPFGHPPPPHYGGPRTPPRSASAASTVVEFVRAAVIAGHGSLRAAWARWGGDGSLRRSRPALPAAVVAEGLGLCGVAPLDAAACCAACDPAASGLVRRAEWLLTLRAGDTPPRRGEGRRPAFAPRRQQRLPPAEWYEITSPGGGRRWLRNRVTGERLLWPDDWMPQQAAPRSPSPSPSKPPPRRAHSGSGGARLRSASAESAYPQRRPRRRRSATPSPLPPEPPLPGDPPAAAAARAALLHASDDRPRPAGGRSTSPLRAWQEHAPLPQPHLSPPPPQPPPHSWREPWRPPGGAERIHMPRYAAAVARGARRRTGAPAGAPPAYLKGGGCDAAPQNGAAPEAAPPDPGPRTAPGTDTELQLQQLRADVAELLQRERRRDARRPEPVLVPPAPAACGGALAPGGGERSPARSPRSSPRRDAAAVAAALRDALSDSQHVRVPPASPARAAPEVDGSGSAALTDSGDDAHLEEMSERLRTLGEQIRGIAAVRRPSRATAASDPAPQPADAPVALGSGSESGWGDAGGGGGGGCGGSL